MIEGSKDYIFYFWVINRDSFVVYSKLSYLSNVGLFYLINVLWLLIRFYIIGLGF